MTTTDHYSTNAASAWQHLDPIYPDTGDDVLTRAADSIDLVTAALASGGPLDRDLLARVLGVTSQDVRAAEACLGRAIMAYGDAVLSR